MPDLADDRAAFREAMARAEAASGIERDADGNEINGIEAIVRGETPVATPELEGAVPVSASDQPLTPEPVTPVPAPTATSEEAPAVEPTVDDLRNQLAAAEARLAEKDNFIGRQSGEVGELRQAVSEMQTRLATIQAQPVQPPVAITPITQELIENRPDLATQAAFAQRNEHALQVAFEAWKEVDSDTANAWLYDRKLEAKEAEFDAKLAEVEQRLTATAAPLAEAAAKSAEQQAWAEAFNIAKTSAPDLLEVNAETGKTTAERLISEVVEQYPSFKKQLLEGDTKTKADAIAALYALDKMGNPQLVQAQLAEAAQEAAAEAAAARAAAGAVTSQTTAGQPTVEKTAEELEQQAYIDRQGRKASLARGWTGRG